MKILASQSYCADHEITYVKYLEYIEMTAIIKSDIAEPGAGKQLVTVTYPLLTPVLQAKPGALR